MHGVSEDRLGVYPARYQDARGVEATTIHNDGRTLRMVLRGLEFSGSDFEGFEPPPGLDAATRASFSLVFGELADCVIEWEMSMGVMVGDRVTEGHLAARLSLGPGGPRGGLTHETLRLVLRWEAWVVESRERGWFEDALADLQEQLPEGVSLRCCFACALSGYQPSGHGLFGGLACFRDNKDRYVTVRTLEDFSRIWPTLTEWVQETFVCPEFQRRAPGVSYRGYPVVAGPGRVEGG